MAHQSTIVENGMTYNVTEFDHTAQEIDDAVSNLGGASTPQGAIAALGAGVRPKLNDNPFFLVNQRGQSSYTGPGYGPDRWMVTGQHVLDMLDGGGVKLTVASGSNANQMIQQYLEPEIFEQLNGKQVTLAAIVTENSMSLPTYFRVGTATYGNIPAGQTGLFFATATINYKTGQNYIGFQCSNRANQNGQSISLRAFTVEAGNTQTLAYQDDSGAWQLLGQPDPLEEIKCKRYQIALPQGNTLNYSPIGYGYIFGGNSARILIPTPVKMRTNPTLVFISGNISGLSILAGENTFIPTSVSTIFALEYGVSINFTIPSGATNGPCTLRCTSGYALLDANLS